MNQLKAQMQEFARVKAAGTMDVRSREYKGLRSLEMNSGENISQ